MWADLDFDLTSLASSRSYFFRGAIVIKLRIFPISISSLLVFLYSGAVAGDSDEWSIEGNLKFGYVHYDYANPPSLSSPAINKGHVDSHGFYTVPKLSISTPTYNNFSAKTTIAGATDFGLNNPDYETRNWVFDATDLKPFAILQEMFVNYKDSSHDFTIGRYELETPLIKPDDYYMLANSYETASYINSSLDNIDLHLGYFHRMAGVWDSGANGTQFHSMSDTSYVDSRDKENANGSGVIYGAIEYVNDSHKAKVWEYYVTNLYNMFLAQYDFKSNIDSFTYETAVQFTNYKEIGDLAANHYTNIDYSIYAIKFDGAFENGIDFATGVSKFSDGEGIDATLPAWGGFPTYTYGFIYNWFEVGSLSNAALYKIQLGYDLGKLGLKNSWVGYKHTYYDLDPSKSTTASGDPQNKMQLNGIRFKYNTTDKGIYLIVNYEHRTLSNEPDASGYRFIGGYRF